MGLGGNPKPLPAPQRLEMRLLEHFFALPQIDDDPDVRDHHRHANEMDLTNNFVQLEGDQRTGRNDREPACPGLAQVQGDALGTHECGVPERCHRERGLLRDRETAGRLH